MMQKMGSRNFPDCCRSLRCGRSLGIAVCVTVLFTAGCGNSNSALSDLPTADADSSSAIAQILPALQGNTPFSNAFSDMRLNEVSGVQRSSSMEGVYYVHNDSGGLPLIYATDAQGQVLGTITVAGSDAIDWEALAGARRDGKSDLIIADIGDNDRLRTNLSLGVIEEPQLGELAPGFNVERTVRSIALSYADGLFYDAEAVFIDGDNDTVVLLTKNGRDPSAQSIWKGSLSSGLIDGVVVLEYRGQVSLPAVPFVNAITDIDIHPDGRQLAVLTYGLSTAGTIHLWSAREGEGTADALTRPADTVLNVPTIGSNGQAEGIGFSANGEYVLIGAEGSAVSTLTVMKR